MNTKRKCQVVLLSTSQQPLYNNIVTSPRYPNMIQKFGSFENSYPDECKVHHLYITSDEEIKEDDWYIGDNIIYNLVTKTNGMNPQKIISTTNPTLNLPQPSKSFIDKYIEEYNEGNPITEVMVEYETKNISDDEGFFNVKDILKVNSDNTINIKSIKNSWSREEVIEFGLKCVNLGMDLKNNPSSFLNGLSGKDYYYKWIEENI